MKNLFFLSAVFLLVFFSCGNPEGQNNNPSLPEPVMLRPTKATPEALSSAIAEIKANPEWIASLEKEALEKKMPLDSVLFVHGSFTVLQNPSKYGLIKYSDAKINEKIATIKSNPEWYAKLEKEAAEKGKPTDQWVREISMFMLDQELK